MYPFTAIDLIYSNLVTIKMDVKEFTLINVGRFSRINVQLAPITNQGIPFPYHCDPTEERDTNITVFIGNNGAGKTSLLTALATSLSWFVARVRREKGNGTPISEGDIKNGTSFAKIVISVLYDYYDSDDLDAQTIDWTLVKTKKGRKSKEQSSLSFVTHIADQYRDALTDNAQASLPFIAFYPVERSVLDIPLKIRGKHSFEQLDGYENSLNQGVDFRRFFEWFRKREDIENESISELFNTDNLDFLDAKDPNKQFAELKKKASDTQLNAVRTAIYTFMPEFTNLRIRRKPRLHISIDKAGETLNVAQLSQGEKSLMALVGDIARRLAMMNPALENPLAGDGIVLIDEIDLHLHPTWQRRVIECLSQTFPNCQFVLTTHSPLVISDPKDILCYSLDDGELSVLDNLYGLDANQVLLKAMNTDIRNTKVSADFNALFEMIQDGELENAKARLKTLNAILPEHIELLKAQLLIRKLELRHAKNQ